jgi:hypothetical protein
MTMTAVPLIKPPRSRRVQVPTLPLTSLSPLSQEAAHPPGALPSCKFDSRVASSFPPLFDEFRGKRFALLWRGSRDEIGAGYFRGDATAARTHWRSFWTRAGMSLATSRRCSESRANTMVMPALNALALPFE